MLNTNGVKCTVVMCMQNCKLNCGLSLQVENVRSERQPVVHW